MIGSSFHILDHIGFPVSTSLIRIESRKSPTAVLFDVDTGRISIRHYEMLKSITMKFWQDHKDNVLTQFLPKLYGGLLSFHHLSLHFFFILQPLQCLPRRHYYHHVVIVPVINPSGCGWIIGLIPNLNHLMTLSTS
ncbi:hypothetical protein Tco_1363957 [Tanacetum coccineum]